MAVKAPVRTAVLATVIVIVVIAAVAGCAYLVYTRPCCSSASTTSSSTQVSVSITAFSGNNSTYTYRCPLTATCDYYLSLTINVTCTGCQFSGEYVSPSRESIPTQMSGSGSKLYYANSFDSPLYLSWNISKDSKEGTLEVRVIGSEGQTYYDEVTSTAFGSLAGAWAVAVVTATESQSSTS